ncbi:MAG: hypothetical protein ABR540_07065 [Acidimicrobiales bacterium]
MGDDMARPQAGGRRRALVFAMLVSMVGLVLTGIGQGPAEAEVTEVTGSACGYITNVGLFGGPQAKLGCEPQQGTPQAQENAGTLSPSVALPAGGSATAVTAEDDGAAGIYGPATIFGGLWTEDLAAAPRSGPIRVSTQGTPGGGSVTSSADISLHPTPVPARCTDDPPGTTNCTAAGGFGPMPVEGDSLHVECTASESAVTGSTKFVKGILSTSTDAEGTPVNQETIPDEPPVNYTRSGVITNVGDVFTVVFNEQIVNPADGSLTVNAVHMYLFGPTAVGEVIKGQATCGTTPSAISANDTVAPTCGTPVVEPMGPEDPRPKSPLTERVGVFDAGGLQSITNPRATNGTVNVPPNGTDYLQFNPGQTGPLPITATRTNESQPLIWSFVATDVAGNITICLGVTPDPTIPTTSTTAPGGTATTVATGATTTTRASTSTTAAGGVTTTTSGSGAGRVQSADPLLPGRTAALVVRELPASTAVNGTLESTLVNLSTVTTDSAGTARFSVVLPADFEAPGTHVLTIRSVTSNAVLAKLRLTVDAAGRVVSTENVGPAGTGGGILARTGSLLRIPLALALALAMVAWGWMLVQQARAPRRR